MAQDLRRTPTSTGNQKVFTYSCWIKRNGLSAWARLLSIMNGSTDAIIQLTNVDKLRFRDEVTGPDIDYISSRPLRDVGSWMHLLVAIDTTHIQAEHRIRMYINGDSLIEHGLDTESMPGDRNLDLQFNDSGLEHRFFARNNDSEYFLGEAFDLFWVDGQALTPDVFGFNKDGDGYVSVGSTQVTDFRPGQWVPKSPRTIKSEINRRGGFGVNGFYLPMNDSSNFGADFHCDPNTIIKLKGEDLPQPRNGAPTTSDSYVSQLRTDPYAANLVFAIPGIATGNGVNLYTNGNFYTDISGWSSGNGATLTHEFAGPYGSGSIKVASSTGSNGYAYRSLSTTVGQRYTLSFDYQHVSGPQGYVNVGNSTGASQVIYKNLGTNTSWQRYTYSFVATVTNQFIGFYSRYSSGVTRFANISLVQQDAASDYSAHIKGSGTNKTVTTVTYADSNNSLHRTPAITYGHSAYGSYIEFPNENATGGYLDVADSTAFDNVNLTTAEWTYEGWFKRGSFSSGGLNLFQFGNTTDYRNIGVFIHSSGTLYFVWSYDGSSWGVLDSTGGPVIPLDEWCHIAIVKEATPISRIVAYVNGVAAKSVNVTSNMSYTSANYMRIGGHYRGTGGGGDTFFYNGGLYDIRFYNTVKYKGGFDVSKPYAPVGFESWRQVPDTCKNNFATWNFLSNSSGTLSEGNLSLVGNDASGGGTRTNATIAVSSGKWYFEVLLQQAGAATDVGIAYNDITNNAPGVTNGGSGDYGYLLESANTYNNNSSSSYGSSLTSGDTFMCAFDVDTHKLYFGKNGTWFGSSNPVTGSNPAFNITSGYSYRPVARPWANGSANAKIQTNFGQNPTFGGHTTAGTYTDGNGKGLFKYQPPTGFLALCEDNLPAPAIADPGEHFKCVLWTGDGNGGRGITGVGFAPDLVWAKRRSAAASHFLFDSVRGAGQYLQSHSTAAEGNDPTNTLMSFDSDGFTSGNTNGMNQSTHNYVAWCWKAGGAAVANTDGALTSQVSVNQDAGFSIATYTTPGTATNFGHGLGKKPAFALFKARNDTGNWAVYHQSLGTNTIRLSSNDAQDTSVDAFNSTAPTDTLMYLGTWAGTNNPNINWVSYLWAEIEGYSKFGSYVGNGNADGPFVYCGFKPAWVMVKCSSAGGRNWRMWDSSRGSTNPTNLDLLANTSDAENSYSSDEIDLLSNGFKIRSTGSWHNSSGETHIFMAFAESPFQTANAK